MNDLSNAELRQRLGGRNLYLIGMMASGKSTTGPELAKAISYRFVDSDTVIQSATGKVISEIFSENGEKGFRDIETNVLKEIGKHHSLVIATGGGIVTRSENWGILHQGIVIWLNLDQKESLQRLKKDQIQRPLLNNENISNDFVKIYNERKLMYQEADLKISIENESPIEVAQIILDKLPGILRNPEDPVSRQTIEG